MPTDIDQAKKNIIAIGRLLWEKNLTPALSGNISVRLKDDYLVTATQTCLGLLREDDILVIDKKGVPVDGGAPSSEWPLHAAVYDRFPTAQVILHVHPVCANGYFLDNDRFTPRIIEARHILSDIPVVEQVTLNVEDPGPVVEALSANPLVVLRNHGVITFDRDLFACFVRIQTLESALRTEAYGRLFACGEGA
ncbi:MAG: class II aldolase/adducin family protein [Candidatus Omnitrophota bacterium]